MKIRLRHFILYLIAAGFFFPIKAWEPPASMPFATEDIELIRKIAEEFSEAEPRGLWSFPQEDEEVAIVPISDSNPDIYKIVMLFDVDMDPPPGTVIGYASPSASRDKWDVWLYSKTDAKERILHSPREFIASFSYSNQNGNASFVFEKPKKVFNWRINPVGLIPFLRRIITVSVSNAASALPYGLYRHDHRNLLRWL